MHLFYPFQSYQIIINPKRRPNHEQPRTRRASQQLQMGGLRTPRRALSHQCRLHQPTQYRLRPPRRRPHLRRKWRGHLHQVRENRTLQVKFTRVFKRTSGISTTDIKKKLLKCKFIFTFHSFIPIIFGAIMFAIKRQINRLFSCLFGLRIYFKLVFLNLQILDDETFK